jgi:DNA-binding response OmpR family regulator/nitrogen-specific signal transduction histidine kinase
VDFVPVGPWNTDGLLIVPPLVSEERVRYVHDLMENGHPVVFVAGGEGAPAVTMDNEGGVRQAIAHLAAHGHRRIAFIAELENDPGDSASRLKAYRASIQEYGLEADAQLVAYGSHSYPGGRQVMNELLQSGIPFTAVLASNDDSAIGAMDVLREAGLCIPEDIAIVGFGDKIEARIQTPPLTTVRSPGFELGYHALELLLRCIEGSATEVESVSLPTRLIVRRSCGCRTGVRLPLPPSGPALPPPIHADPHLRTVQAMANEVLAEAERLSTEEVYDLCRRLVAGLAAGLDDGDPRHFYSSVDQVIQRVEAVDENLSAWQEAILALEAELPVLLNESRRDTTKRHAEEILHYARTTIRESAQRQRTLHQVQQANAVRQLSLMTASFLTAQDEADVLGSLALRAREMGIPDAAVAFYGPEEDDPVAWSTIYSGYQTEAKIKLFPTRQFPPGGFYPAEKPFSLALFPLLIDQETSGFVTFDTANLEPCAAIVWQLAVALKSMRMHREAVEGRHLAEEANRLKSRFLSMVSHELRTPLSLIVGQSEILLREQAAQPLPISQREDLKRIYASAQHLDGLIRDVLDLARIEIGQLRLTCEPLDLKEVLQVVVKSGERLALDKGLRWQAQIPGNLPQVWGDRTRLRQVALNLANNAVKFTEWGEVTLKVTTGDGQIIVSVSDSGLGIPPEEQKAIFDEFRQSERTSSRGYGGLGLGLAICKRLIEMHGGEIGVHSAGEGAGSTFYFILPTLESQTVAPELKGLITRAQRVVILTRDKGSGEQLQAHLVKQGFEVEVYRADKTQSWLSWLWVVPPGVVILDLALASERGWEILRLLRGNPATRAIPVLYYNLAQGVDRGAILKMDYLAKPIGAGELAEALARQGLLEREEGEEEKKILIVDDDRRMLELHAQVVEMWLHECQVLQAHNGREALKMIRQARPDLVLLDLMMPELDGFGVLEAMRQEEASRDIPVIVLTGQVLTEEDMARLNQGVVSVLSTGLFSVGETLAHLEAALAKNKRLGSETQRLVRKAMAYIHEHYAEAISLESAARYVGVSKEYLARCFHQETGVTLVTYLNRYRVNRAKALLEAGGKSITQVAMEVGFSDIAYFSRVFRREAGMPPSAYRKA